MSTVLADDARSAYQSLRRRARALGTISRSFDALAVETAAAYYAALARPAPETWAPFLTQTAALVARTHALDRIVALGAEEREALDFFEAIVRENADLLVKNGATAAAENAESAGYATVS